MIFKVGEDVLVTLSSGQMVQAKVLKANKGLLNNEFHLEYGSTKQWHPEHSIKR